MSAAGLFQDNVMEGDAAKDVLALVAGDRAVNIKQVMAMVSLAQSTIWRDVTRGTFPKPFHPTPRSTRWRYRDITAWMDSKQSATAAERAA